MSDETDLEVNVVANTNGAKQDFKETASALGLVAAAMRELGSTANSIATKVDKLERSVVGVSKGARTSVGDVKDLTAEYKKLNTAAGDFSAKKTTSPHLSGTGTKESTTGPSGIGTGVLSTKQSREAAAATDAAAAAIARMDAKTAAATARLAAHNAAQVQLAQRAKAARDAVVVETDAITRQNSAFNNSAAGPKLLASSLTNTRYAMFAVSNALTVGGIAVLAFNGLVLKAAADYQTAMAQISRTSGVSGEALSTLQNQFVDLAQSVPTSFSDLSKIATLAGQLNIPAAQIADFTKVTAQFATTTNVSAEDAATAFGRLDALLPDVQGNYAALGSSILEVGVNSVATESQIISTASQIASAGAQAGLSADQVLGLSASFASLGIAAEASRGTTIRVFGLINKAVAQGGSSLDQFAKIAGVSSEEFAKSWGTPAFTTNFIKFLDGVNASGSKAQIVLSDLGINAARDQNNLLKLSQNTGLVGDNLAYAADGFQNAGGLAKAFNIQASTLASKVAELGNTFQALAATLGQSGLAPLSALVDAIKAGAIALTNLANNPVVQWAATLTGALTAIVGVALILGGVITRFGATVIAARTAMEGLAEETALAGGGFRGMTTAVLGTTYATRLLSGALATIGITAAIAGISALITLVSDGVASMAPAAEKAKTAFGDLGDITAALQTDTANNDHSLGHITGTVEQLTTTTNDWVSSLDNASGGQTNLDKTTQNTTSSFIKQKYAIGQATAAALANKIANDDTIKKLFKLNDVASKQGSVGAGLNTQGLLTKAASNDVKGAQKIIDDYRKKNVDGIQITSNVVGDAVAANQRVADAAQESLTLVVGALQGAAAQGQVNTEVNQALGVSAQGVADDMGDVADQATTAADAADTLNVAIKNAFSQQNIFGQFSSDFAALTQGIADGGNSFSAFSAAGVTNLNNLQATIASTINAGNQLGLSATESVGALFRELQRQGINTASLLASLANIPGIDVNQVKSTANGQTKLSGGAKVLSNAMNQIGSSAKKAASGIGGVGRSAAAAAKPVRTLSDYASDLGSVFSRAFEIRFGVQSAIDKVTSGWYEMADAAADAAQKVLDAQASLAKLTSDRDIDTYFMGIANALGNTLQAGVLAAKIAGETADINKAQTDLTDAQAAGSKTLVGNSKAAIANRAAIEGMVQSYEAQIQALAASGASQSTLEKKAKQLKAQFTAQAVALGFSGAELKKYSKSFDDLGKIIAKVPRDVTVKANVSPAATAIAEFLAKSKKNSATGGAAAGKAYSNAYNANIKTGDIEAQTKALRKQLYVAFAASAFHKHAEFGVGYLHSLFQKQFGFSGWKTGGYTGGGNTNAVAGVVHKKEFVVDAQNTSRLGLPFLNALNNGKNPTSTQAAATSSRNEARETITYMSPADRQMMQDIANRAVYAVFADSDRLLAQHARNGNKALNNANGN